MPALVANLLVGRERELAGMCELIERAAGPSHHGGIGFLDGGNGTGKTALLWAVEERFSERKAAEQVRFESTSCIKKYDTFAYHAFREMLIALTTKTRSRQKMYARFVSIIKEVGPDLQLIPMVGPLAAAVAKVATTSAEQALAAAGSKLVGSDDWMLRQYVDTLGAVASECSALVLIIDDAQFIDPESCQVLRRLARRVEDWPLVVLVVHDVLDDRHDSPGAKALQEVRAELISQSHVPHWTLGSFTDADLKAYLDLRYPKLQAPLLVEWLLDQTKGNPQFVTNFLLLLEKKQLIRQNKDGYILDGTLRRNGEEWVREGNMATFDTPSDINDTLKLIVKALKPRYRKMLRVGSVEGTRFRAARLAGLLGQDEPRVLKTLERLALQRKVVDFYGFTDPAENPQSSIFAFESVLLHDVLYRQLPRSMRMRYHQEIARLLQKLIDDDPPNACGLLGEAAYHYDLERGQKPLKAAQCYYKAAQLNFDRGLFMEVLELCLRGLTNIREEPEDSDDRDRMLAQLVLLAVASQEMRQRPGEKASELNLLELLDEGERAARRAGDRKTLALLLRQHGGVLMSRSDVRSALQALRAAFDVARESGDALTEMVTLMAVGTATNKENLEEGTTLLYEALAIYLGRIAPTVDGAGAPVVQERHFRLLQMLIGLAEFDRGHFDKALHSLEEAVAGLRRLKMQDDLLGALNYLAQLYMAIGAFEAAEAALVDAHRPFEKDERPNAWDGYNTSVLGKLHLQWDRIDDAATELKRGFDESEQVVDRSLVTIVRNYYAELWMHPAFADHDLKKAKQVLEDNLKDCQSWGFDRSTIVASSLLGQVELLNGNVESAFQYSRQAVRLLEQRGTMPAVRSEEIFFHHSRIARAKGDRLVADHYLGEANDILQRKASSLKDEVLEERFLNRVPLNQSIQRDVDQFLGTNIESVVAGGGEGFAGSPATL